MTDIKQVVKRKRTQSEKLNGDDIAKMRSSDDRELQLMSDEEFNILNGDDIAKMRSSDDLEFEEMSDEEFNIVVEAFISKMETSNE
ncbi:hypothetical protein Tco_1157742 [Tanacetum coccineum]